MVVEWVKFVTMKEMAVIIYVIVIVDATKFQKLEEFL